MIDSLEHLPNLKQRELGRISEIVRGICQDSEMVILFGSYARGDYKVSKDLSPDRRSGHVSDYDILVITGDRSSVRDRDMWERIDKALKAEGFSAHPRVIAHDIEEINIKLAQGHYFFTDIKREGFLLYDSARFTLSDKRDLLSKEKKRIAQDHFDHWFKRAGDFFKFYEFGIETGSINLSAFHLHQCTESCYKSILLVFTNYTPNEHWLELLKDRAVEVSGDDILSRVFQQTGDEADRRFKLLDYAYIGARYDPDYRISKEDLGILAGSVKKIIQRTESLCRNKIADMDATNR